MLPFVQRGLLEVVLLATAAGLLGTWIVLRGLAFYAHAAGTAAFPGLVLAEGLGLAAPVGAFAAALAFAAGIERLGARGERRYDALTALVLVGALALGVVLASDVFASGASVETLLFGSLLLTDRTDLALAALASALALLATATAGRAWLATGFDPGATWALGLRSPWPDALLLTLVALATTAALTTVGALLTTALFVVPAATVRLLTDRLRAWQVGSVALVLVEGIAGLWLSVRTDAPPGAAIAVLAGAAFAVVAVARWLVERHGRSVAVAASGAALVAVLAGCGGAATGDGTTGAGSGPGAVKVVATTTHVADWVRQVGGAAVEVHGILPPNSDPHDYEPRPSDVRAVAEADLVLASGHGLDGWIEDVVAQAGGSARLVDLGADLPVTRPGEREGDEASPVDPHWWHDPRNVEAAATAIGRAVADAEPGARDGVTQRAAAYGARVRRLDADIAACLGRVPREERKLVTDHDAFSYFAARYGITVVGAVIPSQTTQAESSARDVARLVELVRRERVRAIFPESSPNGDLAATIAERTGATADLTLYADTLGEPGTPAATYVGMELANADAMARGFTGGAVRCEDATP
jgi:ABC-type Zn uptake system ZnuABC Zn-binding protein ZnuA/ABC-type Mn2+/Zn2+ transport system permease subunit